MYPCSRHVGRPEQRCLRPHDTQRHRKSFRFQPGQQQFLFQPLIGGLRGRVDLGEEGCVAGPRVGISRVDRCRDIQALLDFVQPRGQLRPVGEPFGRRIRPKRPRPQFAIVRLNFRPGPFE